MKFIRFFFDFAQTILEKTCWDTFRILLFVFIIICVFFTRYISNNVVHVAWTLLGTIFLPTPHQSMLRGPATRMTICPRSTLYGGNGGPIFIYRPKVSQHFFPRLSEQSWENIVYISFFRHSLCILCPIDITLSPHSANVIEILSTHEGYSPIDI